MKVLLACQVSYFCEKGVHSLNPIIPNYKIIDATTLQQKQNVT